MPEGPARGTAGDTSAGLGRVLVAVYAVFALSATGRSAVQIATKFDQAPVPYLLSGLAALVYVAATVGLGRRSRRATRVAWVACGVELAGVMVVGTASLLRPEWFPDATVWSHFGQGYGFLPVALPVVGLLWLLRARRGGRAEEHQRSESTG